MFDANTRADLWVLLTHWHFPGTLAALGYLLVVVVVPFVIYIVPTIIAHRRKHTDRVAITLVNLFTGWTVVGWIGALVWSLPTMRQSGREAPPPRRYLRAADEIEGKR